MTDGRLLLCLMVVQALLANISAMYAVYHGPDGLREIACKIHDAARVLALGNVVLFHFYREFLNIDVTVYCS